MINNEGDLLGLDPLQNTPLITLQEKKHQE